MKKTLINKFILPAVLIGSLAVGSGCTAFYENDTLTKSIVGGLPRAIQPGAYRDVQERKMREEEREKRNVQNNNSILVKTNNGYSFTITENSEVFYGGEKYSIVKIAVPYLEITEYKYTDLSPENIIEQDIWGGEDSSKKIKRIKINDLDVFKEN